MNLLFWLDALLVVLVLLAFVPWLLDRGKRTAIVLAIFLGFAMLVTAGIEAGLIDWDSAYCSLKDNRQAASIERGEAQAASDGMDSEAFTPIEAPDFTLPVLDKKRSISLSDFRGHKPVVLIFGSFN